MRRSVTAVFTAATMLAIGLSSAPGRVSASSPPSTGVPVASSEDAPPSTTRRPVATTTRAATATVPRKPRNYAEELARAIAALPDGSVSVAAVNLTTGSRVTAGSTGGQWMASTYKLFLTEALLAANGSVSDSDAAAAIEHSDNPAGYRLYLDLGGTPGTVAAFERFGMTHTDLPGNAYDPTFATTSAADCLQMLRNVVEPGQLTATEREYVVSLMKQVEPDQLWGVGAAATGLFVNKNGWEKVDSTNRPPEPIDNGRWIVNSIGIVERHGQRVLLAVLTQHNPDLGTGITLVEKLAKLAGAAVAPS